MSSDYTPVPHLSSLTPSILEPMHAARLSIRLLHTLYQLLEPHGDTQSADFDAPRQPLLGQIASPDFALTSSVYRALKSRDAQ